jgi:hypothetical protein
VATLAGSLIKALALLQVRSRGERPAAKVVGLVFGAPLVEWEAHQDERTQPNYPAQGASRHDGWQSMR